MAYCHRRPIQIKNRAKEKQQREKDSRLISTLRLFQSKTKQNKKEDMSAALSTPLDMGDHENSQSKWLKQKDQENPEIHIIEPILPKGLGRRKSIFIHNE